MKKGTKKLMSLTFAFLMAMTLIIPAMASSGSGTEGQYDYSWWLTKASTSGTAHIRTPHVPTTVGAAVANKVRSSSGKEGWAYSDGSTENNRVAITGYATANASASNVFTLNSVVYSGTVMETHGTFWVNSIKVEDDVLAE